MKRSVIFIFCLSFVFVACKKNFTCRCVGTDFGEPFSRDTLFEDMRKQEAEAECNKLDFVHDVNNNQDCQLR